jgi:hypothetical protein
VTIFNKRNAILGWGVWQIGKRVGKKKAREAVPAVDDGKPNKSAVALAVAGAIGALAFWRKRKGAGPATSE